MKGKIRWWLLTYYLATVTTACLGVFVNPLFFLLTTYILIHYFFGPLDWYLIYKALKMLVRWWIRRWCNGRR